MPRPFAQSTAELVMQVTEAVQANGDADSTFVQNFCDLSATQADNALQLSADLGVLQLNAEKYTSANPIVSFVATPDEGRKAALLRVVLESYEPFIVFRNRLTATNSADTAAQQTKVKLDINAHREEIKDTLISLGTYTSALSSQGGGRYTAADHELDNQLQALAAAANDQAAAETIIRQQIGARVDQLDRASGSEEAGNPAEDGVGAPRFVWNQVRSRADLKLPEFAYRPMATTDHRRVSAAREVSARIEGGAASIRVPSRFGTHGGPPLSFRSRTVT